MANSKEKLHELLLVQGMLKNGLYKELERIVDKMVKELESKEDGE